LFSCHPRASKGVHAPPPVDECGGVCGEGPRCVQEQCRIDYSKDVCGIAWRAAQKAYPMSSPIRNWGESNKRVQLSAKSVNLDDSEIPTCDAAITQHVDMADMETGSEKLSDEVLKSHMREVEYSINECLATAACYSGEPLSQGSISLRFRVEKTGTVAAVTC